MNEPKIKELSYARRQRFFFVLVVVFLFTLPSLIFYTTGYRLSFENEETNIVSTGGMYVTTDNLEVDVYLNEEQVEEPRLFRRAYYIQNIESGLHRVVVQRPDLQTWVKELPVDPHMVIEAAAFNMPLVPHVRPITEYVTATGTPVFFVATTTEKVFGVATTTVPVFLATSTATSTYEINEEFVFVESLFSTTSTSSRSVFERFREGMERFRFATTSDAAVPTTTPEVPVESGNMRLIDRDGELYAVWQGAVHNIPPYFCVTDATASTAKRYGQHVADEVERLTLSTTTPMMLDGNRLCRPEVKLDRLQQDVYFYGFYPNSADLVVLQLEDGLYVTEIDDRAWQNSQQLYPGADFRVVIENESIFVHDDEKYFEIITEIEL